jgi:GTP-binding protein EngB required for normal cell division
MLSATSDINQLLVEVSAAVRRFYGEAIDPVAERFSFSRRQNEGEINGPPIVLMLGNHSSGKSSFINYLLQQDIQTTGLAPTDDGFTILAYGDQASDRDGPGLVNNPDQPYTGLRHFGDDLVTHVRMKLRPIELLRNVILIDSPGMIDEAKAESGRGFDFPGVVQWFAERADIVLMFFDPDKPGTTGETLQVFNDSLRDIDHKLLIVMNKMDQFRSLPDLARAYGALCWNLAKVIPRKDLPMIYNTFVPVPNPPPPILPMGDFEAARERLVQQVHHAPMRRADNMLTQLQTFAERLRLHARVIDSASRNLRAYRRRLILWALVPVLLLGAGAAFAFMSSGVSELALSLIGGTLLVAGAAYYAVAALTRREERHILAELPDIFEKLFAREFLFRERSNDLHALWDVVAERTRRTAQELGLLSFPKLRARELERLDELVEQQIPSLRSELHDKLTRAPTVQAEED